MTRASAEVGEVVGCYVDESQDSAKAESKTLGKRGKWPDKRNSLNHSAGREEGDLLGETPSKERGRGGCYLTDLQVKFPCLCVLFI